MIADLFLRTYPCDYKWLPYLFRSLARHARGWRDLVITLPRPSDEIIGASGGPEVCWYGQLSGLDAVIGSFMAWGERLRGTGSLSGKIHIYRCDTHYKDDYLGQCITKLRAWEFSDADEIAFLDSDLILLRDWTPETLRGLIEVRNWDAAPDAERAWRNVTSELLGQAPPFETMARHPFQYPAQFIRRVWGSVADKVRSVLATGTHISEFNLLGNYAVLHERASFLVQAPEGPDLVRQFWSYAGITCEVEDEMRKLGYWED